MVQDPSFFSKQRCQALMSPFMVPHWTLIPLVGILTCSFSVTRGRACFLSGKVILSQSKFISPLSYVIIIAIPIPVE